MSRILSRSRFLGAMLAAGSALSLTPAWAAPGTPATAPAQPGGPSGIDSLPPALRGYGHFGLNTAAMDTAVKPGDDFFEYGNGTYLKDLVIPPDLTSFGPFVILMENARAQVRTLLADLGAHPSADPKTTDEKLGVYYATFLDQKTVDGLGTKPLEADLNAVRGVHDAASLSHLFGQAQASFQFTPFGIGIQPDDRDPTKFSISLGQGGLGMPDRDYYLKPGFAEKKTAYQAYIAKMLGLLSWPDADAQAARIVAFETQIAQAHWARDAMRDPVKAYNPMTVAQLQKAAPGIDWTGLLTTAGIPASGLEKRVLVVGQPSAISAEAKLLQTTDMATVRAWLAFHLADNAATYLSQPFTDASFEFNGHVLSGQPMQQERWKRAVRVSNEALGWAIGQAYSERYFPASSKAEITKLVAEVKAAFKVRLQHNAWMEPATRAMALRKIDNFEIEVGYPKTWRDYSGLKIVPGDAYGNAERAMGYEWAFWLHQLGHRVDRSMWFDMTPQTVNAENLPNFVEVVFPAAILQPPFFDPKADPAVNYGAIGGVIGHEMTHSFDDQGRQYDEHGRLHDWWTKADEKKFTALADRFGAQYGAFTVQGVHLNPKLTMGENIADLGGLTLGLDAYHASLHGKPAPVIDGLTGDQRVFLAWAQVWRQKLRPDAERARVTVDPHSPPKARVNLPMHNIDAWYDAFGVQPGQALYLPPSERVKIW
ncbi:M13 family metallopeptidase [Tanticharoenia sakaeratensis]|uniref:Metallopeptidase n=1 Tax=Tanticharoenia sakaeratensis NBRC 103193 TaxID=1231623 RepID=A0A0D6MJD8_9PROT|nr:M13 family metallopeptidase [Tanticharoenia sakaeratensis]GAN53754.1 metallopeptidase [Tanticharoenia sakaeratensis NBRC 103193]